MRLVHLSDLHLGFRAYFHLERGWNRRERDLASSFLFALQEAVRLRPDIVLITGDLFDGPNPPSTAFLTLHRGISRFRRQLPGVPVLIIAGERDSPRNPADPGPVAAFDSLSGVEAAVGAPRAVRFRAMGLHALLVPFRAAARPPLPEIRPDPSARWNVLLVRGDPCGSGPAVRVDPAEWDYVAVGGAHRAGTFEPNVRTAGAPERPGTCPWREATEERGFLSFDLAAAQGEFHPITGRPVVDLAPVRVSPGDLEAGTRRFREVLLGVPGGIEGKIVRVRLRGDIVAPGDGVSQGLLDAARRQAAHLEVHMEPLADAGDGSPSRSHWEPETLSVPGVGDLSLKEPGAPWGITLVTSEVEAWRARLIEVLRGEGEGGDDPLVGAFRIDPTPPSTRDLHALWAGGPDPISLIDALFQDPKVEEARARKVGESNPGAKTDTLPVERERLETLESALTERRADWVEASGDLEAANLQWAQERQAAESRLQAYRDRAAELRARIRSLMEEEGEATCPTCNRTLGKGFADLLEALRGEWENLVQDGRWWARRRAQLEEKPEKLQRLEEHALRLQVRAEETAEALERYRATDREPPIRPFVTGSHPKDPPATEASLEVDPDTEPRLRDLLRRAGGLLSQITEGRLVGARLRGGFRVVGADGSERVPSGLEEIAACLAVHLAIWLIRRSSNRSVGALLIWELHQSGVEELLRGVLEVLSDRERFSAPILLVAPPTATEHVPGAFFQIVELAADDQGRQRFRYSGVERSALAIVGQGRL